VLLRRTRYYQVPAGQPPLFVSTAGLQVRVTTPPSFLIVKVSLVVAAVAVTVYPVSVPTAALIQALLPSTVGIEGSTALNWAGALMDA
jgi:hypothetical protein